MAFVVRCHKCNGIIEEKSHIPYYPASVPSTEFCECKPEEEDENMHSN